MKIAIVGAGGHGRVVLDILMQAGTHEVAGFVDSNPALVGRRIDGRPVLGASENMAALRDQHAIEGVVIAIGDNGVRRDFADRLEQLGFKLVNAIHPSANIARNVTLGNNLVIAAGALVGAHCHVGDSVILNTGCIVDHESLIGPGSHICPGARLAGRVSVDAGAFVGIGATVIQNIRIGYEAVVGAGAVVIRDVEPMSTVVGVPAQCIRDVPDPEAFGRWMLPTYARAATRE
jgi:sugar O-acyltransferase (sialic acid O-acetyltransferase NeuD family)